MLSSFSFHFMHRDGAKIRWAGVLTQARLLALFGGWPRCPLAPASHHKSFCFRTVQTA
jgi:hypothetical protein